MCDCGAKAAIAATSFVGQVRRICNPVENGPRLAESQSICGEYLIASLLQIKAPMLIGSRKTAMSEWNG